MARLGKRSLERLATCHPDLQRFVHALVAALPPGEDITVLCGHRTQAEQDAAVARGASKTPWPRSRHNSLPSQAVDLAPYPIDWLDDARWARLGALGKQVAAAEGIAIEWGGDWPWDRPHWQLRARRA